MPADPFKKKTELSEDTIFLQTFAQEFGPIAELCQKLRNERDALELEVGVLKSTIEILSEDKKQALAEVGRLTSKLAEQNKWMRNQAYLIDLMRGKDETGSK